MASCLLQILEIEPAGAAAPMPRHLNARDAAARRCAAYFFTASLAFSAGVSFLFFFFSIGPFSSTPAAFLPESLAASLGSQRPPTPTVDLAAALLAAFSGVQSGSTGRRMRSRR